MGALRKKGPFLFKCPECLWAIRGDNREECIDLLSEHFQTSHPSLYGNYEYAWNKRRMNGKI